jgi:tetratricopeptide (TPR) repeat protein
MRVWVGVLLLLSATARAQEASPSPEPQVVDVKVARQFYDLGAEAYEKGDYPAALRAFEAAWAEAPHAELQFNIARCHERMGKYEEAARALELYLATKKNAPDILEMRARIAELRLRAHPQPLDAATPPPPAAAPGLRIAAGVMLGTTLALAAAGTGAYFSAWGDYATQRDSCQGRCAPGELDNLRSRVEVAQLSGAVLFTLAGVALITDVTLWVVDARTRRK